MESNHRPPPYQGGALPTELRERIFCALRRRRSVERETGIEPALVAWKATVLPLNYSRTGKPVRRSKLMVEGGGWLRPLRGLGPSGRALRRAQHRKRCCRTRACRWFEPPFALARPAHFSAICQLRCIEVGGGRWIRTTEGVSQQIYSLPPLAAWVSLRRNQLAVKQPVILTG